MPTFKPAVLGAAFLALSAYAQPDPRDVDPDAAVLSLISGPCMDFDLDCILERTECADPCDCDPQCTGSQSSAGEIDEDPWLILGGDPCDNDPDC